MRNQIKLHLASPFCIKFLLSAALNISLYSPIFAQVKNKSVSAHEFYVSPTATDIGEGTITNPWNLQKALNGGNGEIASGDIIWLRGGTYTPGQNLDSFWTVSFSGSPNSLITWRAYKNEVAKIDRPWKFGINTYHRFQDLEFFDSKKGQYPNPTTTHFDDESTIRGNEWINDIIHDTHNVWAGNSAGASVRGCVIWYAGQDPREHVIYPNCDKVSGNIVGWTSGEFIELGSPNIQINSNIIFGAGETIATQGKELLIAGQSATIDGNMFYSTQNKETVLHINSVDSVNCSVTNNTLSGTYPLILSGNFSQVTLSQNIIHMNNPNAGYPVIQRTSLMGGWTVDSNSYSSVSPRNVRFEDVAGVSRNFNEWKNVNAGFDINSTSHDSSLPQDQIFIISNQDDINRAYVVVYNWSHKKTINLNPSSLLSSGDHFSLLNAQNYLSGPIQTGILSGNSISIDLETLSNAPILYGSGMTQPQKTTPEFACLVLFKTDTTSGGPIPPAKPSPTPTPPGSNQNQTELDNLIGINSLITPNKKIVEFGYILSGPTHVEASIYTSQGNLVIDLKNETVENGNQQKLLWDGRARNGDDVSSGVYILKVKMGEKETVKKIVVIR